MPFGGNPPLEIFPVTLLLGNLVAEEVVYLASLVAEHLVAVEANP